MDNSQEGVVDSEILMILMTFCSDDTGFIKCFMTETVLCGGGAAANTELWRNIQRNQEMHQHTNNNTMGGLINFNSFVDKKQTYKTGISHSHILEKSQLDWFPFVAMHAGILHCCHGDVTLSNMVLTAHHTVLEEKVCHQCCFCFMEIKTTLN